MDHVLAKVKGKRKQPYFKLISDTGLYDELTVDVGTCVPYSPDHNLDEDGWFKIEEFSEKPFCMSFLRQKFDSKDYEDLSKEQFAKIAYFASIQGQDVYFQKITPSLFIKRKMIVFGEAAKIDEGENRLVVNAIPDAVYFRASDTLVFRSLATISSIFQGIDVLYREATKAEVEQFLAQSFIELDGGYDVGRVSKPNRKRIGLAVSALEAMSADDKTNILGYIDDYCKDAINFDQRNRKFLISTDEELKLLLYGIEQRFYTTPFGREKRLANSVQPMG